MAVRVTLPVDSLESAQEAGLRYVVDNRPGIRRRRAGRSFSYIGPDGTRIRDPETVAWIKRLAIPPAWSDVWICPDRRGHIQATGRDARGRKQYRYHPRWREVRDQVKYGRMVAFGRALPQIRAHVEEDLGRPGLPREKVLATIVRLLEKTRIRVGNEEYVRQNRSFGLSTLRDRHAHIAGSTIRLRFKGKAGKVHEVELSDRRLARIVARCQDLPGQELFQYVDDDGQQHSIDSADVNAYLQEISGQDFTAKDFRTWAGTVLAAWALREFEAVDSEAQAKKNIVRAVEQVAERLGNTPAVSRKSYVHPVVLDAYLDGDTVREAREKADQALSQDLPRLEPEEAAVLVLLRERLSREERGQRPRAGVRRTTPQATESRRSKARR
ncbi:MAG: DNA topoisomerase IB [Chloroflexota bacterium]|nr:DNA topoisomerase IB [Chloroflexota bacterium]